MTDRPHVVLSVASSLDGRLDDASPRRLLLSNDADFDRVDAVRADVDAILVGAGTVRADDPRLEVRSPRRRADRLADGRTATPTKVTVTAGGDLDPRARFFTVGDGPRLVYTTAAAETAARDRLGHVATVVALGTAIELPELLADLSRRGVRRLLVEGGARLHTELLRRGLFDRLDLVIAPFFIGDAEAPRFAGPGVYRHDPRRPLRLDAVERIGEVVYLRYLAGHRPPDRTPPPRPGRSGA